MKIPFRQSVNVGSRLAEGFARNVLANAGGIVAVVTIISMITSHTFRGWVRRNPYPIFIALIISIVIIMILLNQLLSFVRNNPDSTLRTIPQDPGPTEHDRQLFLQFAKTLRSDSKPMRWLKQDFSPESLPWEPMHSLEEAVRRLDLNPIGFDDQSINAAYAGFRSAVADFREKVQLSARANAQNTSLDVPDEWRFENKPRYEAALIEIQSARDAIISSYDKFFLTCHKVHADGQPELLNPG